MSSKIPRGVHPPAEMKKTAHKPDTKDTATVTAAANAAPKSDGILKSQKENAPRKNVAAKVHKGVSTRYGQQAELKEQNQHLTVVNEELQKNLSETQQRLAELELQFSELEKENSEVQKNLRDCHVLLVAAKVDPVLGERVGKAAELNEHQRKEAVSVSSDLLNELITFKDTASQQRVRLEEIQATMTDLTKEREQIMQERQSFSLEAVELEKSLREAEALLL